MMKSLILRHPKDSLEVIQGVWFIKKLILFEFGVYNQVHSSFTEVTCDLVAAAQLLGNVCRYLWSLFLEVVRMGRVALNASKVGHWVAHEWLDNV